MWYKTTKPTRKEIRPLFELNFKCYWKNYLLYFRNYQKEDGLVIPEVLRKYIPGEPEFIPYIKELPKNTTSVKKAKGKN